MLGLPFADHDSTTTKDSQEADDGYRFGTDFQSGATANGPGQKR
jgi:hypothetical protein